jgi:hypothetical protein
MELSRIGSNRKEVRAIAFTSQDPSISVDTKTGNIRLIVSRAKGMGTQGEYDYTVTLSPKDLVVLLGQLASERSTFEHGALQSMLQEVAPALLRLLFASTALPFQLAPSESQLRLSAVKEKLAARTATKNGG